MTAPPRVCVLFFALGAAASLSGAVDGSLKWRFVTESLYQASVVSSPAIGTDGTVYVGVKVTISSLLGINNGRVLAINPNGSLKWTFEAPTDWVESSPAVAADGTVYAGSWDGKLYAISPPASGTTATQKWAFDTGNFIFSSPAIGSDGTIYVGSGDATLHAIAPNGIERWQFPVGDWVDSSPAIGSDGSIYFGSWDNNIYCVSSGGIEKWRVLTGGSILSSPSIGADGTIYCGSSDGRLYAISPDGVVKWSYLTGDTIEASPVLGTDGTIYVGSNDRYFYALKPDGTLKWRTTTGIAQPIATTAALRADGTIIFAADDNKLHALKAADGSSVGWTFTFASNVDSADSSPVIAPDGTIYVGTADGRLISLNGTVAPLTTGSPWPMFHHDARHTGVSTVPAITAHPQTQSVTAGSPVTLTVAASGAGLSYQWFRNNVALTGATAASYAIAAPTTASSGSYTVTVTNTSGAVPSNAAALTVIPLGYLSNLSVRAAMSADKTLIVGFVVDGGSKPLLVRAAGPTLTTLPYGLIGVTDPALKLYNGASPAVLVAQNENWDASVSAATAAVGAFPFVVGGKDAALLQSVSGPHSAWANATDSGTILVEAYDAGPNDGRQLVNLSARFPVGTGDNILIAGFVLAGTGTKQLLIRAVGPKLGDFGVPGFLADPRLGVFDGPTQIFTNDDWDPSLAPTFGALGAFALTSSTGLPTNDLKSAAQVFTLQAGKTYTVQVSGVNSTTGEALVEIYAVP